MHWLKVVLSNKLALAMFSKIKSVLKRNIKSETLCSDECGVFIRQAGNMAQLLKWAEVCRIAVFKRDEYISDLICIEFTLVGEKIVVLNEEVKGYSSVVQQMHLQYENIEKDWYPKIVQPAFERNYRVIYYAST